MSTTKNLHTFPIAAEVFGAHKVSIAIPKSSTSAAILEMLGIFVCFAAAWYACVKMYAGVFSVMDSRLPGALVLFFGAAYAFQMFVAWTMHQDEAAYMRVMKEEEEKK